MSELRLRNLLAAIGLAAMLLWPATGATLGATCSMTVTPSAGPPGSQFVFKGNGFTPTEFRITQGTINRVVKPGLGTADPWTYSFVAGDADVGRWKVIATDGRCQATAFIRVTLPPTATVEPTAPPDRAPLMAALAGLSLVFLISAALIFRRSRYLA